MKISNQPIQPLAIQNKLLAEQVLTIQQAAYTIEARRIQFANIPYRTETLDELQNCQESFIGYFDQEQLVAVLSYELSKQELEICRLVVYPKYFGLGIATKLLTYLEEQILQTGKLIVSTALQNTPAVNLYKKLGYHPTKIYWVENNTLELIELEKQLTNYPL